LLIPERQQSYLFFFFGNDTIHLTKPHDLNLQQGSCFVEYMDGAPFIGEEIGLLPNFTLGTVQFSNNRAISCVPPILNLDAYLIYDSKQLYVSHTINDAIITFPIDSYTLLR
jgi:hypothetical protein